MGLLNGAITEADHYPAERTAAARLVQRRRGASADKDHLVGETATS